MLYRGQGSIAQCYTVGRAKTFLLIVAASFVVGWSVFPALYLLGPEGFDLITQVMHTYV